MVRRLIALVALFTLGLGAGVATAAVEDVILKGEITDRDFHHYIERPFAAPKGVVRLEVQFHHDGADQRTTIDIGLLDPERFRGWSGGNKSSFDVGETDATPSYLPGPLPVGDWRLLLGVPNIRPGVVTHYEARIHFVMQGDPETLAPFTPKAGRAGPAWYRGDFHAHTGHSDGSCASDSGRKIPCGVERTLDAARRRDLDFVTVTDHNTESHVAELRNLQDTHDRLLILPGRELTTFQGHANGLGLVGPVDFRLDGAHVARADDLADAVHVRGALFSINHPSSPSGEACMGCGWTPDAFDMRRADAVEVVNGGSLRSGLRADGRLSGLSFWEDFLRKGFRITAIGGSDNHAPDLVLDGDGSVGRPTTVVRAERLTPQALLDGVRRGHVFVDLEGVKGRHLEVTAPGRDGAVGGSGDAVAPAQGRLTLHVHVVGAKGGRLVLVTDEGARPCPNAPTSLVGDDMVAFDWRTGPGEHFAYVRVYDAAGRMIMLANPIYVDRRAKAAP